MCPLKPFGLRADRVSFQRAEGARGFRRSATVCQTVRVSDGKPLPRLRASDDPSSGRCGAREVASPA